MPNRAPLVMIVDDSEIELKFLDKKISQDYETIVFNNPRQAYEYITSGCEIPHVAILDVCMPEMDGYHLCEQIKSYPYSALTQIVFVSGNDGIEEKIKGYNAGGSDYLHKPVNFEELSNKINQGIGRFVVQKKYELLSQKHSEKENSSDFNSLQLNAVLRFYRGLSSTNTYEGLGNLLANFLADLNLSAIVQVRSPFGNVDTSTKKDVTPLEAEILASMSRIGRLYQRGSRLIINYEHVTLIIKNFPDSSTSAYGDLKDHLTLITESANKRACDYRNNQSLVRLLNDLESSLNQVKKGHANQKKKSVSIMDDMMVDVNAQLLNLALTEAQELSLLCLLEKHNEAMFENYELGYDIEEKLNASIVQLKTLIVNEEIESQTDVMTGEFIAF